MADKKIRIGLTFTEARHENYPVWIQGSDADIEIVELHWDKHSMEEVWDEVEDCHGIVLSGGVDVHPDFYENERTEYPNGPKSQEEFNKERDEFEMHVFETALHFDKPVLAICRGLQLVNVALGGDLVQDLEENGKNDHRRHEVDGEHEVKINSGSLLHQVAGTTIGRVNSAHHQAVGKVADELIPNSSSPDGVIEGAEWKHKADKPFLLAVQWHPERITDKDTNPLSKNIRAEFLKAVRANA